MIIPLLEQDFPSVRAEMIRRYAGDQVRSGRWQADDSVALAQAEFDRLLPSGMSTPDHAILAIRCDETQEAVGTMWVRISEGRTGREAFLCDIQIGATFRRKGHARQALLDLQAFLRENGVVSIGLHVFSHNSNALALYQALGFRETSINMHKPLPGDKA